MSAKVVVGVQWGDEGKGKIIDILASRADVVIRSQGGNNAGHTVENNSEVYKLHLIPSGILYKDTLCLIGCGVVIDPKVILQEIDGLIARGIDCKNLRIDPRAHVIMPWHIALDGLSEKKRGNAEIGTTRRGIGPCYMDKAERCGIRMYDLVHPELFREKAMSVGILKNDLITKLYEEEPIDLETVIEEYVAYGKRLEQYIDDVSVLAFEACKAGKNVLFEGAQGTLLDLDMGTYPFVTSSDMGELIRQRGHEFGTTTGRPRRTGWFDAVILRHAVRVNGLTGLAINKLDTLSDIGKLKICVAYKKNDGTILNDYPASLEELALCEPVYEEVEGFTGDLSQCKTYDELPQVCKDYIKRLEEVCGCPVIMVGVGPARSQNLER